MCHILFFSASQKQMYTLTCTLTFTHISIYFIRTKLVVARVRLRAYIRYIYTHTCSRVTSFKKIEPEQQQKRKHKHTSNQKTNTDDTADENVNSAKIDNSNATNAARVLARLIMSVWQWFQSNSAKH